MERSEFKSYRLHTQGLSKGLHVFDYELSEPFFCLFDETKDLKGKLTVIVELNKQTETEVKIQLNGKLERDCDRCLEPVSFAFEATEKFLVKKEACLENKLAEDILILEEDENTLLLANCFYDVIATNLPFSLTHQEGECSEKMLTELNIRQKKEEIDPRWKELKKLIE